MQENHHCGLKFFVLDRTGRNTWLSGDGNPIDFSGLVGLRSGYENVKTKISPCKIRKCQIADFAKAKKAIKLNKIRQTVLIVIKETSGWRVLNKETSV